MTIGSASIPDQYKARNARSNQLALLLTGLEQHRHNQLVKMQSGSFGHVFERMRSWVAGNF